MDLYFCVDNIHGINIRDVEKNFENLIHLFKNFNVESLFIQFIELIIYTLVIKNCSILYVVLNIIPSFNEISVVKIHGITLK